MSRIVINLSKIEYNAHVLKTLFDSKNIAIIPVIKSIAGDEHIIKRLMKVGFNYFAESRQENIPEQFKKNCRFLLLRAPLKRQYEDLIKESYVSIQTEIVTIRQLNHIANKMNIKHQIILMVDWKDQREGVLLYHIVDYVNEIKLMNNITLLGLAFNFMCFKSKAPTLNDVEEINKFVRRAQYDTGVSFQVISGGNSSMLPLLKQNDLGCINELRVGETLFRGVDTTTNQNIPELFQNAILLEAEIIEIKPRYTKMKESYLQAIVDVGYIDTVIEKIKPLNHRIKIIGASSDHLMIDLNQESNYKVGDCIPFSLEYEALSQLMYHQRMEKHYSEEQAISQLINNLNQSKHTNNI
ncbi:ornithine racemase [Staphylococcus hominis]